MEPIALWMCERNIFPQLLNALFRNYWLNLVTHTADCSISVIFNNLPFRKPLLRVMLFCPFFTHRQLQKIKGLHKALFYKWGSMYNA